jgi:murein DD-endopeptidase MepM/ murein hydrolase activator NlpD
MFLNLSSLLLATANPTLPGEPREALCGKPLLEQVQEYRVQAGESLEAIARKHKVTVATLQGMNPKVRKASPSAGDTLKIPPYDGLVHTFENEETYRTVAQKYSVRADVLFERNGCQQQPRQVFVVGAVWKPAPIPLQTFTNVAVQPQSPAVVFTTAGYPLPYPVPVTSNFGWRTNPVTGIWSFHSGIDLGAPSGTPVLAAKPGTVDFADWGGGYGNLVEVTHSDTSTRYAHLSQITVKRGQRVVRGQQIGLVGATGRVTGPHLHFEVIVSGREGWVATDPAPFLNRFAHQELRRLSLLLNQLLSSAHSQVA